LIKLAQKLLYVRYIFHSAENFEKKNYIHFSIIGLKFFWYCRLNLNQVKVFWILNSFVKWVWIYLTDNRVSRRDTRFRGTAYEFFIVATLHSTCVIQQANSCSKLLTIFFYCFSQCYKLPKASTCTALEVLSFFF